MKGQYLKIDNELQELKQKEIDNMNINVNNNNVKKVQMSEYLLEKKQMFVQ